MRKAHLVKAGLLTKVAKSTGKNFTILSSATNKGLNFKKIETATFGCADCKTEFASIKGHEPFCVTCSSANVKEISSATNKEDLASYKSDEVASVQCNNCQSFNILSMQTATMLDSKLNCVQCGTEISYELPEDDDELENPDIATDELEIEDTELDTNDGSVEDLDITNTDDADMGDDVEDDIESEEDENAEVSDVNDNPAIGTDAPEKNTNLDSALDAPKEKLPEVTEQEKPEGSTTETKVGDEGISNEPLKAPAESEEIALLDLVEGSLVFERYGEKIVASVKNTPVAILAKVNALPQHAAYFNSKTLIPAIEQTAKISNIKDALASFNFELTKVKIPVPAIVQSRVKAEVAKVESEVTSKLKELKDDYKQCLSLASVGLSKKFWKGKTNIIKTSLIENMEACGVRNAEKIVSKVFIQHSNEYHRTLLETAEMLMSNSIEHRNEIAETLNVSNFIEDDEDLDDNDSENNYDGEDIEARLEKASISAPTTKQVQVKTLAVANVTSIVKDLREKNGGSMFGSKKI